MPNPFIDWIAVACGLAMWIGYDRFAKYWARSHQSLIREMNWHRREWAYKMTYRDNRIADVAALANLSSSPTFFASTTIIIIGGLLALLGSTREAVDVLSKLPFIAKTSEKVWELKVVALLCIFVYAFFSFTWALRLFNFATILVGSAGLQEEYERQGADARVHFADRLGRLIAAASSAHNNGLRAYYFSIATLTWFVQPLVFMIATAVVVTILYRREFKSEVLQAISGLPH